MRICLFLLLVALLLTLTSCQFVSISWKGEYQGGTTFLQKEGTSQALVIMDRIVANCPTIPEHRLTRCSFEVLPPEPKKTK